MDQNEQYYALALTRQTGFNQQMALELYRHFGSASALYEHRRDIGDVMPAVSGRTLKAMEDWDESLRRAAAEMEFTQRGGISVLTPSDDGYPARLQTCPDAPVVLFYKGTDCLNRHRVVNIVGTRHCTSYGQDIVRRLVGELREQCPDVLIVSGLAYGIDICAHRNALEQGLDTVGVLAHGLDQIYPPRHRDTAVEMLSHGGLLTEYMSQTEPLPNNFRQRNRIVAGISDATILVESAFKGGGLITCRIAMEYGREVFAFPGNVGMPYSEGCNNLIRSNGAALITSAADLLEAMGWQSSQKEPRAVERQLFPELTADEQRVVSVLQQTNDLQLNMLNVRSGIAVGQLTALLFSLEMKGVVRLMAGGVCHLLA